MLFELDFFHDGLAFEVKYSHVEYQDYQVLCSKANV